MRVLIFHGYLLRGTGSNVYVASVARALAGLGHEVHLVCQERAAAELDWVDRVGRWAGRRLVVEGAASSRGCRGTVTAYLPEIGGLLPVYVEDRYEGFRVKAFPDLSEVELDAYLEANVAAVRDIAEAAGGIDAALANHLVAGPAILARTGLPFAAKIHGSALAYTVRPHPGRFLPLAQEGLAAARAVLVGSTHTARSLWELVGEPSLPARTRLAPPGVDAGLAPRPLAEAPAILRTLAADVGRAGGEAFGRNPGEARAAIEAYARAPGPRVAFVGKLIVSKGPDLLLAAWPLVHRAHPDARLLLVGFGEYREALERLLAALERGELAAARELAARGRELEGGSAGPLTMLTAFLEAPPAGYAEAARGASGTVALSGRLEHAEVGRLLAVTDATVVPSTFPEAFGMVAAEAAAAGSLPICADHSGLAEVAATLAARLDTPADELVSFGLGERAVSSIAGHLQAWLALDAGRREEARRELSRTAAEQWSWERGARGVLAGAAGDLEALPPVS